MFEITLTTAESWLRNRGRLAPGPVDIRELADGVSNAVLRVAQLDQKFILKQARAQLRTREAWFSDLNRIWRERDALVFLAPLLPPGSVPAVLFWDEPDFALAISHAPEPFQNWRSVLLHGEGDPAWGADAGRILGLIHRESANRPADLAPFTNRTIFEQLRTEPFYLRIQERCPEVAMEIAPLITRLRTEVGGLCHGDFSPKNLLRHATGFMLVDYETCHRGDSAMDLGFFLSHILLKMVHLPATAPSLKSLTRQFWQGYRGIVGDAPWLPFATGHLGACLLARVDGTSPAPYLTALEEKERVRRLARRILQENPQEWEAILAMVD